MFRQRQHQATQDQNSYAQFAPKAQNLPPWKRTQRNAQLIGHQQKTDSQAFSKNQAPFKPSFAQLPRTTQGAF